MLKFLEKFLVWAYLKKHANLTAKFEKAHAKVKQWEEAARVAKDKAEEHVEESFKHATESRKVAEQINKLKGLFNHD